MKVLGISPLDKDSTVTLVEDGDDHLRRRRRAVHARQAAGRLSVAARSTDALERTGTQIGEIDGVVYPFLTWEEETRLFERNLANERDFLDEAEADATADELQARRATRMPAGRQPVPGLGDPNERMEKGLAQDARLSRARERGRRLPQRRQARLGAMGTGRRRRSTALARGARARARRARARRQAEARRAPRQSRGQRVLHERLRRGADRHARRLRVGPRRQRQRRPRRHASSGCTASSTRTRSGTFYESVTSALGFKPSRHEGKIVGLAAYGDPGGARRRAAGPLRPEQRRLPHRREQQPLLRAAAGDAVPEDRRRGGLPARARASRRRVRRALRAQDRAHEPRAVGRRRRQRQAESAPAGDPRRRAASSSTRTWATAAAAPARRCSSSPATSELQRAGSTTSILGPEFIDDEIAEALSRAQLPFTDYTPIEPKIAALIAAGKVVARFNGRMEYGPRALGNRSILYHAKEPAVNQWLNQRLGRTEFMPFAPATLYEHRDACYRNVDGRRVRRAVHDADLRLHRRR